MNPLNRIFSTLIVSCLLISCNASTKQESTSEEVVATEVAKPAETKEANESAPSVKKETGNAISSAASATSLKKTSGVKSTETGSKTISAGNTSKSLTASVKPTAQSTGTAAGIQSGISNKGMQNTTVKATNTSGKGPQTPQLPGNISGMPTKPNKPSSTTNTTGGTAGTGKSGTNTGGTSANTGGGVGDVLGDILGGGAGNFTEGEAAKAIKEALMKGISAGVDKVSVTNGYFGNSLIKIPFPKDAQVVETTLRQVGMGSMIDNMVLASNRAAESAAKQALPIFVNSITQMTISDAINIVSNKQSDAATQFLQRTTTEPLVSAFKPSIKSALDKTLATKYWADIMGYYNKIPFVQKVNTDLTDFVTRKAVSGLFYMIAQEEAKIRKDPGARTSDILKKVFGNVKF